MADDSEDPRFGRVQPQYPIENASRHRVSAERGPEEIGDDRYGPDKSSTRLRPGPYVMENDDENGSDHRASLPTAHEKREQERQLRTTYRPKVIQVVNWRAAILDLLAISHEISDERLFEAMGQASDKLKEVDRLRAIAKTQQGPPRAQVIHTVHCYKSGTADYLDEPFIVGSGLNIHLRASQPINNFELFLERNKEIAFIVYKKYECCKPTRAPPRRKQRKTAVEIDARAFLTGEHINLLADELKIALTDIFDTRLRGFPYPNFNDASHREQEGATLAGNIDPTLGGISRLNFDMYDRDQERTKVDIHYPYTWYFHGRKDIDKAIDDIPSADRRYITPFRDYIESRMSTDWMAVDTLLEEGMISAQYMEYLFVPGRIVISQQNGKGLSQVEAFVARDWLRNIPSNKPIESVIEVESWKFDGRFRRIKDILRMDTRQSTGEKVKITELPIYPAEFADEETVEMLRCRGRMFWKCRTRNYVSYVNSDAADGTEDITDPRYMIDIAIYKKMRGEKESQGSLAGNGDDTEDELESEHMAHDDPDLQDEFFMCLPTSIPGFHMQKKEWINLQVHYIKDVVWNTAAFDFLVIDPGTKKLVRAVVTNHIRGKKDTDLISGKGNGLFILLHGGPGTGKTLTAESVAEIAKRPLYRVTCGDIGTKAETVEKYLEFVLFLGRTWDCVVLLDEADVFLEQRSLVNLERNALVSVFLRVLEYYDGILILTSNRVGIFDEAFKSRIQLNLRYRTLDEGQRLKIWNKFLERLEGSDGKRSGDNTQRYGINMQDIKAELATLARVELNGRQIRNVISTACELASYDHEPLEASHIKMVIQEVKNFDEYLYELKEHFTSEEIQRDSGVRL